MIGPRDETSAAGAVGHSPLRASRADREQVIDALKAAFVDGRLARDEFDRRVGQVLAAYANLDALIADIPAPARPTAVQPPEPARESNNKKLIARGAAAGASVTMVLGVVLGVAAGNPALGLFLGVFVGSFVAVLLTGFLTFLSWILGKAANRQSSPGQGPGASGKAGQRSGVGRLGRTAPADRSRPTTHGRSRPEPPSPPGRVRLLSRNSLSQAA